MLLPVCLPGDMVSARDNLPQRDWMWSVPSRELVYEKPQSAGS